MSHEIVDHGTRQPKTGCPKEAGSVVRLSTKSLLFVYLLKYVIIVIHSK